MGNKSQNLLRYLATAEFCITTLSTVGKVGIPCITPSCLCGSCIAFC
ncbi:hypothetical protein H206_05388 [Candidatus Electrothrix aarhusensis]|uniref:Uncharacterized protein n=1 Tax=Candidatus Electrothrix aarhusensis TaxID=1859131 RepID=A0A3S4TD80_9BACT|nr:hypothetical protein H206_05388 [Candidatus Electrothrix aarhusensis]